MFSILGPPMFTLNDGSINTYSLLPPEINKADIDVLIKNAILSTNLIGRWKSPNDSFLTQTSLKFPIFHQSDEGLYKFYVTSWYGQLDLAITIRISIIGEIFYQLDAISFNVPLVISKLHGKYYSGP